MKNWRNKIIIGKPWTFKPKNAWIQGWNDEWKLFMKVKGGYKAEYGTLPKLLKIWYNYLYKI